MRLINCFDADQGVRLLDHNFAFWIFAIMLFSIPVLGGLQTFSGFLMRRNRGFGHSFTPLLWPQVR